MVAVTVILPRALVDDAGGRSRLHVTLPEPATLDDVLEAIGREAPAALRRIRDETGAIRRFVNVYVGDDESRVLDGLATPMTSGTVVHIIPSVAGGA